MLPGAPPPLQRLVGELQKLPGIGEKTALRLAFHILRAEGGYAAILASAIAEAVQRVRLCSVCCSLTDADPCAFCRDPRRDDSLLCVVEGVADLMAVERTREYRGRYHVLHGALSPLEGIGPDQLRLKELIARLADGVEAQPSRQTSVQEVIVATNPDVEGEATALYLTRLLRPLGVRISRIAQGVPMGGDLEFADQATLARALLSRREL
jgi:recombination protein RecR